MPTKRAYHHGDLARALLDAAVTLIDEVGVAHLSLRELARRTGVSNAAPGHHFGDKAGLFTALAAEGFALLADALGAAAGSSAGSSVGTGDVDFAEVGVAYVQFALTHRAHFEVMFRPELYHCDDPAVVANGARASSQLYGPAAKAMGGTRSRDAGVAAWSLVHGLATLIINGNLDPAMAANPTRLARRVTRLALQHSTADPTGSRARA